MCLIAFAIGARPDTPLLLASNRDEFFDRPTQALHRWPDGSGIWAGRDQRDGGTWLGIGENGRVALLTNVRSARNATGARSRGELATRWLQGHSSTDRFAASLDPSAYGGFNLVLGDLHASRWAWLCNRNPLAPHADTAAALHRQDLPPGLYGLSNAALDTPWPKTQRLKAALAQALQSVPAALSVKSAPSAGADAAWMTPLENVLSDTRPAVDPPPTGVPTDWERQLSSPFVQAPEQGYGTRSSLLMRVHASGAAHHVHLCEWTHAPGGWSAFGPVLQQMNC